MIGYVAVIGTLVIASFKITLIKEKTFFQNLPNIFSVFFPFGLLSKSAYEEGEWPPVLQD